ncbi:hypothetical protein ASF21_15435 [Arthrobacter sp. Leaf234]|nr:hypothetical protein ASF21_15435 [Arthrobacter sp. Leaf234]
MGRPMTAAEQYTALSSTVHLLGISLPDLWLEYYAMGGNLELLDLDAYVYGINTLPAVDRSMLEQVLRELDPVIFNLATDASGIP